MMAQKLEKRLKTNIVVENKPGAMSNCLQFCGEVSCHGYTLLHTTPALIINPLLNKKLGYDNVFKDFAPITNLAMGTGYVMVINPNLPAKNSSGIYSNSAKIIRFRFFIFCRTLYT
jgi:tripartite-type tricarboxylate transporter receptor subunit TctC